MDKIDTRPLVSVVLNTRNRANLLQRSIKSVLSQTYLNWELIIVDGESTDNTRQVIDYFCKLDKRIRYLYCENRSAAYCINSGFKCAQGEFVAILDDDDEFLSTKLEKQVRLFLDSAITLGVVYCWEEFWNDRLNKQIKIGKFVNRGNLYEKLLHKPASGGGTLMLIRKEAIDKIGGYDDTIKFGCDYQFNLNISRYYDHDYVPEVLVRTHWYHEYFHSTTQPGSQGVDYNAVIEYYEKILSDHWNAYQRYPVAMLEKYKSIIGAASRAKENTIIFKYLINGLRLDFGNYIKVKFMYFTMLRFVLSLLNK